MQGVSTLDCAVSQIMQFSVLLQNTAAVQQVSGKTCKHTSTENFSKTRSSMSSQVSGSYKFIIKQHKRTLTVYRDTVLDQRLDFGSNNLLRAGTLLSHIVTGGSCYRVIQVQERKTVSTTKDKKASPAPSGPLSDLKTSPACTSKLVRWVQGNPH